eukprot:SAG31_NODE_3926_length_3746_cov_1.757609_3_plen_741_part_00
MRSPPALRVAVLGALMLLWASCVETRGAAPAAQSAKSYVLDYSDLGGKPYTVSFDRRSIRLGGKPAMLLSGSIHYPRSTPGMWPKLMAEARAAGLNTIESYVFWNYHQRELADYTESRYDYSGRGNVTAFLQAAKDANLFVIWRFGPYICAEWPSGGMPGWLRQVPGDKPRTPTPVWEKIVGKWASDHFSLIAPFLAKNGGPVIMSQAENEYGCRTSDPNCAKYMQSLSDLANKLDTGLLWENCHGTVAPGMIGAGNGCGGSAGCVASAGASASAQDDSRSEGVCRNSRVALPSPPGDFNDSSTFPAMITEDEQWFDYWGFGNVERSVTSVAYGVASFIATGGAMHNYYMWHGGNHYGNWSLDGEGDDARDGPRGNLPPAPPFNFGVESWNRGHPALGTTGPVASTNTQRYANAAPMHSDGTRNEPRWSHLAALQNLLRNHSEAMLTTSGVAAPISSSTFGCTGLESHDAQPAVCVAYAANTSQEITFAIGGSGGHVEPPERWHNGSCCQPVLPAAEAFIYGQKLGMPANTVLVIGSDKKTVLWNSSQPPNVDLTKHKVVPASEPLKFSTWTDAKSMTWHAATFDAPAGDPVAVLLDLAGMRKGMAFVNGGHVANYDLALASCNANGTLPVSGQPNSFPGEAHWKPKNWCGNLQYVNGGSIATAAVSDTYPDGGCGQPSQRYYHVPCDWLKPTGNILLLTEHTKSWNGDSCVSGWGRAVGGCHYANNVADLSQVSVVSRN